MGVIKAISDLLHIRRTIEQTSCFYANNAINSINTKVDNLELLVRKQYLCDKAINSGTSGISNEKYCEHEVVVSLTTYGERLYDLYLAIESIMQGTMKPNRIVLWLAEDEFKGKQLPIVLQHQQTRGLEIRYCKDFISYNQLVHTIKIYPESIIITINDNYIYPYDFLERFIISHNKYPKDVICSSAREIVVDDNDNILPYKQWKEIEHNIENGSLQYIASEAGGVLYPPQCLNSDVVEDTIFMKDAPLAEDLWFKIMEILQGTICRKIKTPLPTNIWLLAISKENEENVTLESNMVKESQLKNLCMKYGLTPETMQFTANQTSERIVPEHYLNTQEDYILYLKHQFAYQLAISYIKPNYKVLEIGCGEGYGALLLSKTGAQVIAVDVDECTIKKAKRKYRNSSVLFETYDGIHLNHPEHTYDVIVSFQVIEHVQNVQNYLSIIHTLLKPNGLFFITTPNRTYRLSPNQLPFNPYHYREYDFASLKDEVSKSSISANIYSITANEEILKIEKERCRKFRNDFDPQEFNFVFQRANFSEYFGTDDFYISDTNIDNGLDLLLTNIDLYPQSNA